MCDFCDSEEEYLTEVTKDYDDDDYIYDCCYSCLDDPSLRIYNRYLTEDRPQQSG